MMITMTLLLVVPAIPAFHHRVPVMVASIRDSSTSPPSPPSIKSSPSRARQGHNYDRRQSIASSFAMAAGIVAACTTTTTTQLALPASAREVEEAFIPPATATSTTSSSRSSNRVNDLNPVMDSTSIVTGKAEADEGITSSSSSSSKARSVAKDSVRELLGGLAGGAASRASKELLLHPIDTIKVS